MILKILLNNVIFQAWKKKYVGVGRRGGFTPAAMLSVQSCSWVGRHQQYICLCRPLHTPEYLCDLLHHGQPPSWLVPSHLHIFDTNKLSPQHLEHGFFPFTCIICIEYWLKSYQCIAENIWSHQEQGYTHNDMDFGRKKLSDQDKIWICIVSFQWPNIKTTILFTQPSSPLHKWIQLRCIFITSSISA